MLKKFAFLLPVLIVLGISFSAASWADQPEEFVASELYDPFNILGGGEVGNLVTPPTVTCPGNEPTGIPLQPCPVGSRTHNRNGVWISRVEAANPDFSGMMTVTMNSNMSASYEGPSWGTFSIALDSGGTWDGKWHGVRIAEDGYWTATLHVQGTGFGGSVDGKKMVAEEHLTSIGALNLAYFGTIEGRIVDPK